MCGITPDDIKYIDNKIDYQKQYLKNFKNLIKFFPIPFL